MRTLPCIALLTGCAEPISNAVFYEDDVFASALPAPEDLDGPAWRGTHASNRYLMSADTAFSTLDAITTLVSDAGAAVRERSPSERTADLRAWGPFPYAIDDETGELRVEALRLDTRRIDWTVEWQVGEVPGRIVADGSTDTEAGSGSMSWTLDEDGWVADFDRGETSLRVDPEDPTDPRGWWYEGTVAGWSGAVQLEGDTSPGIATLVHLPTVGGWWVSSAWEGGASTTSACWGPSGEPTWEGEGDTPPEACAVAPP